MREYRHFCKLDSEGYDVNHMRGGISDNYDGLTKGEAKHRISGLLMSFKCHINLYHCCRFNEVQLE